MIGSSRISGTGVSGRRGAGFGGSDVSSCEFFRIDLVGISSREFVLVDGGVSSREPFLVVNGTSSREFFLAIILGPNLCNGSVTRVRRGVS